MSVGIFFAEPATATDGVEDQRVRLLDREHQLVAVLPEQRPVRLADRVSEGPAERPRLQKPAHGPSSRGWALISWSGPTLMICSTIGSASALRTGSSCSDFGRGPREGVGVEHLLARVQREAPDQQQHGADHGERGRSGALRPQTGPLSSSIPAIQSGGPGGPAEPGPIGNDVGRWPKEHTTIEVAGREVRLSSPSKVFFPKGRSGKEGFTKLDLAEYYMAVADAAVNQLRERPGTMKRFVDGVTRRVLLPEAGPEERPRVASDRDLHLPQRPHRHRAGRQRRGAPGLGGQPRRDRLQPPPGPAIRPRLPRRAAGGPRPAAGGALEHGPPGRDVRQGGPRGPRPGRLPEDLGSRGIHVNVRIEPEWDYVEVRRAALALAREVERRVPKKATSKWWKEERHGVFVDYNQNARDRTIASGYSVRPVPDAKVCCPISWEEVPDVEPGDLRLDTVPGRLKRKGDPAAEIDEHAGSLDKLLDLARRDEEEGLGDAPGRPTSQAARRGRSGSSRRRRRSQRPQEAQETGNEGGQEADLRGGSKGSCGLGGRMRPLSTRTPGGWWGPRSVEERLAFIARESHGVVSRRELLAAGATEAQIKRRLRRGSLIRVYPGVYRVGHAAPSIEATYAAAVKACGDHALLAGRAAGRLHRLFRGSPPPEVIASTSRRVWRGVRTRRTPICPADATTHRGIPITTVPRTIVDLAAVLSPPNLARAGHEAAVDPPVEPAEIEAVLSRRHNWPGCRELRAVLWGDVPVTLSPSSPRSSSACGGRPSPAPYQRAHRRPGRRLPLAQGAPHGRARRLPLPPHQARLGAGPA